MPKKVTYKAFAELNTISYSKVRRMVENGGLVVDWSLGVRSPRILVEDDGITPISDVAQAEPEPEPDADALADSIEEKRATARARRLTAQNTELVAAMEQDRLKGERDQKDTLDAREAELVEREKKAEAILARENAVKDWEQDVKREKRTAEALGLAVANRREELDERERKLKARIARVNAVATANDKELAARGYRLPPYGSLIGRRLRPLRKFDE